MKHEESIEDRLEKMGKELGRLRRHNHWLLGMILLFVGILAVPLIFDVTAFRLGAQRVAVAKEIRARRIVVEDDEGNERISLNVFKDLSNLIMNDGSKIQRVTLTASKYLGSTLRLAEENFRPGVMQAGVHLGVTIHGPKLSLVDQNHRTETWVSGIRGGAGLGIVGSDGNLVWRTPADE
jgi:hypothetical protein